MKYKGTILFWIDVALLAAFVLLGSTGAIMRWILPPGTGGRFREHSIRRRELLELTRHEWGDIHFWIALGMVTLVIVHLALHWGWIKGNVLRYLRITRRHPSLDQRS